MNIQLFSQLIKDIYSLCLDQDLLIKVLNEFAILFRCQCVGIRIVHHRDFVVVGDLVSTCSDAEAELFSHHLEQIHPHLRQHKDIERSMDEGAVYLFHAPDFYPFPSLSTNLNHAFNDADIFSILFRENDFIVQLVIQKGDGGEQFFTDLAKYSNMLLPHVHKAFNLFHALEKSKGYSTGFEQTVDHINSGLMLFDRHNQVVYQNHKSSEIFFSMKELALVDGRILVSTPQENARLKAMISSAVQHGEQGEQGEKEVGVMTLPYGGSDSGDLALIAIPLHPRMVSLLDCETGVCAALMIGVVQASSGIDPDMLHLLYGLTQSEARLAACLAGGKSLEQCSASHGISLNTARSYLKLIFQKTGTSRQAELVALIKSIPVPNGKSH